MRIALRILPAVICFATVAGMFTSASGCGPPELFLGAFADAEPPVIDDAGVPQDSGVNAADVGIERTACDPSWGADASPITAFQSAECRSCALSACCAQVAACFVESGGSASACAAYAECIDECRRDAGIRDASPSDDASAGGGPVDCEATCSSLPRPDAYSQLAKCLADACACPQF